MTPKLSKAEYVSDYKIRVSFGDGRSGVIDLKNELWGEVFEPLKDPVKFREFTLNAELQTIVWPTGADLAPEFLYRRAAANVDS